MGADSKALAALQRVILEHHFSSFRNKKFRDAALAQLARHEKRVACELLEQGLTRL
jgi:hypothetical protein